MKKQPSENNAKVRRCRQMSATWWSQKHTLNKDWLSGKESVCNAGDTGSTLESARPPGGENGNPLQYSCLESSIGRGAWQSTVHRVAELDMTKVTEGLSTHAKRDL